MEAGSPRLAPRRPRSPSGLCHRARLSSRDLPTFAIKARPPRERDFRSSQAPIRRSLLLDRWIGLRSLVTVPIREITYRSFVGSVKRSAGGSWRTVPLLGRNWFRCSELAGESCVCANRSRLRISCGIRSCPADSGRLAPLRKGRAGGAQGRIRTTDPLIFSQVLYQLSYLGNPSPPDSAAEQARRRARQNKEF